MVEIRVQVRVHLCDAWKDLVVGLLPAFAQEFGSLVVPNPAAAGRAGGERRSRWTTRVGGCCLKKGDWKTTLGERKGFCAGRSPWGGFSLLVWPVAGTAGMTATAGTLLSSVQHIVALEFLLQICRSEKLLFIAEEQESGSVGEGVKPACPCVPVGGTGSSTAVWPGPGGTAVPTVRVGVSGVTQLHTSETSSSLGPSECCLVSVAWPGLSYLLNFAVLPLGYYGLGVFLSPLNSEVSFTI